MNLGIAEALTVGLVNHLHSHAVVVSWHGHLNLDHLVIEKGGYVLNLLALSRLVHEANGLVANVILKDAGDERLQVGSEISSDIGKGAGDVTESFLLVVGVKLSVTEVTQLVGEADEGIVARSEDSDAAESAVLGLSEETLEFCKPRKKLMKMSDVGNEKRGIFCTNRGEIQLGRMNRHDRHSPVNKTSSRRMSKSLPLLSKPLDPDASRTMSRVESHALAGAAARARPARKSLEMMRMVDTCG